MLPFHPCHSNARQSFCTQLIPVSVCHLQLVKNAVTKDSSSSNADKNCCLSAFQTAMQTVTPPCKYSHQSPLRHNSFLEARRSFVVLRIQCQQALMLLFLSTCMQTSVIATSVIACSKQLSGHQVLQHLNVFAFRWPLCTVWKHGMRCAGLPGTAKLLPSKCLAVGVCSRCCCGLYTSLLCTAVHLC